MSCCQTQVRPILLFAQKVHLAVIDRLEDLIEGELSPRAQFLADYLLQQEKLLEEAVHQGLKRADAGTLNAFVDAKPSLDASGAFEPARIPDSPTVDDLTGTIFTTRDALIEVLRESARCASDRKVKELLLSFWKLEEAERNQLACSVMQLDGL